MVTTAVATVTGTAGGTAGGTAATTTATVDPTTACTDRSEMDRRATPGFRCGPPFVDLGVVVALMRILSAWGANHNSKIAGERRGQRNVVMKRSRNASIGNTGAAGSGRRPGCQPHPAIRFSTAGSRATMVTGTSCVAFGPLTTGAAWWSPRNTSTRLSLPYVRTQEIRLLTEYAIDRAYSVRTRLASRQSDSGVLV